MTTKKIIEKYFECINSGDLETWVTLFDDHVVVDEALSGHMEGIQAIKDSVDGIEKQFSRFENHIQEIVVEGNKGMVVCRIEAVTSAGVPLESTGANFYKVENGKIVYMSSFHDKEPFIKAFSASQ
jgi:ketosteroid isomerase-like protein